MISNEALGHVLKPTEASGDYEPVGKYLAAREAGKELIKKTITNKLGEKRVVWVKKENNG